MRPARAYATALRELALEAGAEERYLAELTALRGIFRENPDYLRLLSDPAIPKAERRGLLRQALDGRVAPDVLNALCLLTDGGELRLFAQIVRAYEKDYNAAHGILEVTATTAVALSGAQREALAQKLQQLTGKQIQLACRVDPTALGGVQLEYDGQRVDGTVRARLASARRSLMQLPLRAPQEGE